MAGMIARSSVLLLVLCLLPVRTPAATEEILPSKEEIVPSTEEILGQAIDTYTAALDEEERARSLEGFRTAARLFAKSIEGGIQSPSLYTNLGNASLQAGRLGPAVLAYRRALHLDPDHPRALQNLEHARAQLPAWAPRPTTSVLDSFFFWRRSFSETERTAVATACFALAGLLLALSLRLGQRSLRNLALLPGLIWAALLGSIVLDPAARARDDAVIVADEVRARAADSMRAPSPFPAPLPGGMEVRILEDRPPWVRVRLANGRDAWLVESSVSRVVGGMRSRTPEAS